MLNLTCHSQSIPTTIGTLTKVCHISGPNLIILAWMGDKSLRGQGQCQSPHKTLEILSEAFCIFGPNLVILAWMGYELSWHTDAHTDAGNYNTRRSKLASSGKHAVLRYLSETEFTFLHDPILCEHQVTRQYTAEYVIDITGHAHVYCLTINWNCWHNQS